MPNKAKDSGKKLEHQKTVLTGIAKTSNWELFKKELKKSVKYLSSDEHLEELASWVIQKFSHLCAHLQEFINELLAPEPAIGYTFGPAF